ncbi:hypothetical protein [Micromonospora sp. NPDC049301]|uniref:hypothetical protein n=1 Tax=Micromonospora sp. NPDC049301 TaxID=3155723 RepID=UPI003449DC00
MSMNQSAGGEFARMLDTTVGALRVTSPEPEDEETARRRRTGESANGLVQAEFGPNGRLTALSLDPRLTRLGAFVQALTDAQTRMARGGSR